MQICEEKVAKSVIINITLHVINKDQMAQFFTKNMGLN